MFNTFSILREFYLGNITPCFNLKPEHPCYNKAFKKANDLEDSLLDKLSDTDKKLYNEMMSERTASYSEEVSAAFVDGFTLGALFLIEITEKSKIYENKINDESR